MASATMAFRGVSALSGLLGLAVITVSSVLLAQSLGYRQELGYIFGYQLPNLGTNYNRYSYNVLGYEIDPLIGISAGGIAIGVIQLIACFLLCCARRNLSIGWAIIQVILLLGTVACFAIAIYFQVYSRKILPGYGALGLGATSNLYANSPGLGFQNSYYNGGGGGQLGLGINGAYDSRFAGDYLCNPTGQAYCAILGINVVFLLVSLIVVGGASRNSSEEYGTADERIVQKPHYYSSSAPMKTKV